MRVELREDAPTELRNGLLDANGRTGDVGGKRLLTLLGIAPTLGMGNARARLTSEWLSVLGLLCEEVRCERLGDMTRPLPPDDCRGKSGWRWLPEFCDGDRWNSCGLMKPAEEPLSEDGAMTLTRTASCTDSGLPERSCSTLPELAPTVKGGLPSPSSFSQNGVVESRVADFACKTGIGFATTSSNGLRMLRLSVFSLLLVPFSAGGRSSHEKSSFLTEKPRPMTSELRMTVRARKALAQHPRRYMKMR